MLNYGQEAYKTLVDPDHTYQAFDGTQETPVWQADAAAGVSGGFGSKVAVTLSLMDNIQLNVYIDDPNATVSNVTFKGAAYDAFTTTKVANGDAGTITRITFGDMDIVDAKNAVSFTVTLSDSQTFQVTTGIKEYVVQMVSGAQGDVIRALQKYVDSVVRVLGTNS